VPEIDVDALFQLPLGEFTAARNALAARLKKSGRADDAERIKGLPKPSISAWAANQLFWKHRAIFDRLIASGEEMRRAQAAQLAGKPAEVRKSLEARRKALTELASRAAELLTGASHNPTPDMMRRITTTLEALSVYGGAPGGPAAGRLLEDVDPPGFETLAALVPGVSSGSRAGSGPSAVIPFQKKASKEAAQHRTTAESESRRLEAEREAKQAAAREARKTAERDLREARTAAERAEAALKKAATRVKAAEQARGEAEQRLEKASAELTEAKQAARQVAAEAEQAAQAVADAERALEKAQREE
jgi:hypothetical protein